MNATGVGGVVGVVVFVELFGPVDGSTGVVGVVPFVIGVVGSTGVVGVFGSVDPLTTTQSHSAMLEQIDFCLFSHTNPAPFVPDLEAAS